MQNSNTNPRPRCFPRSARSLDISTLLYQRFALKCKKKPLCFVISTSFTLFQHYFKLCSQHFDFIYFFFCLVQLHWQHFDFLDISTLFATFGLYLRCYDFILDILALLLTLTESKEYAWSKYSSIDLRLSCWRRKVYRI